MRSVRVFHEATHVPAGNDLKQSSDDTHAVFSPDWVHEYHGIAGSPRTLLVGRSSLKSGLNPLAINLETLDVGVFPQALDGYRRSGDSYFSRNGEILEAHRWS